MTAARPEGPERGSRGRFRDVWADRPLRTKGLVIIALPMLILFVALFWVGLTTRQEEEAEDSVQRTLQIEGDLQRLEAVVYRAALASGPLGGDPAAATRAVEASSTVPRILADLSAAVQDPEQRERLQRVAPIARETAALLRDGAAAANRRAAMLDALGRELEGMRDREAVLLVARMDLAVRARKENLTITRTAGLVGLLGSLAAMLLFSTGVVRRVRFLEANAHRLARGEPLATTPAGADEIGRLGSALHEASALLSERQHRLEELVGRLFQVQEDERRRVAYELHDGLAQVAASAHQHLQAYAERFPPGVTEAQAALERGLVLVQRTVGETRAAIAGLRPTALDDFGLSLALALELDGLRPQVREATLEDELGDLRLSPVIETALFRIAQEALTNIRKHAGPSARVRLRLEARDGIVCLSIHDDGLGFERTGVAGAWSPPGERIGLEAMRERAALLGGRLHVTSIPGEGTRVEVEIPELDRRTT